jgi:hypothetical protein
MSKQKYLNDLYDKVFISKIKKYLKLEEAV